MNRRRGVLALWLLLTMAGLAAALAGLSFSAAHRARTAERYRAGLAAQYAAESGAVWGLSLLRQEAVTEERSAAFSLSPGTETAVRLVPEDGEETEEAEERAAPRKVTVYARGTETASGLIRYVVLCAETAEGTVTVTEVDDRKWS